MKNKLTLIIDKAQVDAYNAKYKSEHPRSRNVAIKSPLHPSINQWMILRRIAMNQLKQKYGDFTVFVCERLGVNDLAIADCEIEFRTYYPTNRRHDPDNTVPKFFLDGLVAAGVLVDDSDRCIRKLTLMCALDREAPRSEIEIIY